MHSQKNIKQWYYNLMGPPSYMRSVVDRNVVMRRIPVLETENSTDHNFIEVFSCNALNSAIRFNTSSNL